MSGLLLMSMGFGTLIMGNVAGALMKVMSVFSTFRCSPVDLAIFAGLSGFIHAPSARMWRSRRSGLQATASAMGYRPRPDGQAGHLLDHFFWNICSSSG